MQTFRGYVNLPDRGPSGPTLALGNFDGVHRGHRAVIAAAREAAPGSQLAVATFEPHPRSFFNPAGAPFRLTPEAEKSRKLAALGVDQLYVLEFGAALSRMSPDRFVREVLVNGIGVSAVTIGGDFRFGAERAGDAALLTSLGRENGFSVNALQAVADEEGALFSSSSARAALREGKPEDATAILGAPHRISGVVETGDQRGRKLNFPTANLPLEGLLAPKFGVYAIEVELLDGRGSRHAGVANIGLRPTFEKTVPVLEAHLFDFDGDLYGTEIAVALIAYLRVERKFDGLDALTAQIAADARAARRILTEGPIPVTSPASHTG